MKKESKASPYRWGILAAILPIIISTEMMWLTFAPVSAAAEKFYGTGSLGIDLFSVSYMLMFILFSIPSSWVIDRFGFRTSLIAGALLTAVFGVVRAVFADQYLIVLTAQFFLAVGQPFLLNISTKVPANWFPLQERATAAGILTMAQYIGFAVPMLLAPMLQEIAGIPMILRIFAVIGVVSALISIGLTRERPANAVIEQEEGRDAFSIASVKSLFHNRSYQAVLWICFISMGIFNALLTLMESILSPRGISSAQSGTIGAVFVLCGIAGAVILPVISDKLGIRTPFFAGAIGILTISYLGFAFFNGYIPLLITAAVAGFSIMGVAPVLFQHGSELAYPVQEGTSLGMILLMGQVSGAVMVWLFEWISSASGNMRISMLFLVLATAAEIPVVLRMKESVIGRSERKGNGETDCEKANMDC